MSWTFQAAIEGLLGPGAWGLPIIYRWFSHNNSIYRGFPVAVLECWRDLFREISWTYDPREWGFIIRFCICKDVFFANWVYPYASLLLWIVTVMVYSICFAH